MCPAYEAYPATVFRKNYVEWSRLTKGRRGHKRDSALQWGSRGYLFRDPSNAVLPTTETYQENQRCFQISKNFPFQPQMQMERTDETEIFHNKKYVVDLMDFSV